MAEVLELDVGVIDVVLDQVLVKISNRRQMTVVLRAAGDLDAQLNAADFGEVFLQQDKGIVGLVAGTNRAEAT